METVTEYSKNVQTEHPRDSQGLGKFGEPNHIKLLPDAKPFALYTLRRVSLLLCQKVKEELIYMDGEAESHFQSQ